MPKKDNTQVYGLKPVETQLLKVTQQNFQTVLSNEIAMIAIERFAYNVTPYTRFVFNEDMTAVTISEDMPEAEVTETGIVE